MTAPIANKDFALYNQVSRNYGLWYAYSFPVTTLKIKRRRKMPKMKTHRSAAKRYKVTATGKIMKRQAGIGHLLQHKSSSRKRRIFKMVGVSESHVALVSKELPYKKYSR